VWVTRALDPGYTDLNVSPSTSYTYAIVPVDYHWNSSATVVTVTTPPAGSIDPRRVGVRPTGSYWERSVKISIYSPAT